MRTRAIGAVVSAPIHLYLWFDGVKDQGVVGALALLRWRHWIPLFLLSGLGVSTLGAFLIAATVGPFGIRTGWSWYAWVAAVSEVGAILLGVVAARQEEYLARLTAKTGARQGRTGS